MKSKKTSKGKPAGKRGIKDLPVSDGKAKDAKGGFLGSVVADLPKNLGSVPKGISGLGPTGVQGSGYTQDEMGQDLK